MARNSFDGHGFPVLSPPFHAIDCGEFGEGICDGYGRTLLLENRNRTFVEELCMIMNENSQRLVEAWKKGVSYGK